MEHGQFLPWEPQSIQRIFVSPIRFRLKALDLYLTLYKMSDIAVEYVKVKQIHWTMNQISTSNNFVTQIRTFL